MHGNRWKFVAVVVTLVLTSCEAPPNASNAKPESTPKAATALDQPVSGKTAFWEMYKSAHSWAADLLPLELESKTVPGMKTEAGKAVMWSATFGSPTRKEARVFTYSAISRSPDIYKGVTVGNALPWTGPTPSALTFTTSDFAVDSDAAYTTASALAATWTKSHPDKDVSFTLGNASRFPNPVWYVLWGDKKAGYAVFVNAKTGAVLKQ